MSAVQFITVTSIVDKQIMFRSAYKFPTVDLAKDDTADTVSDLMESMNFRSEHGNIRNVIMAGKYWIMEIRIETQKLSGRQTYLRGCKSNSKFRNRDRKRGARGK